MKQLHSSNRSFVLILFVAMLAMSLACFSAEKVPESALESWYDVKAFGAVGDGKTDDTDAIQKAIDEAKKTGGTVYLPSGRYSITSLDLTNVRKGLCFRGSATGLGGSYLIATKNDVDVLDLTGSLFVYLEHFFLGCDQGITPRTAILLAQVPGGPSNAVHFEGLYVTGNYSLATVYCFAVPSSDMQNCDFYNYYTGGEAAVMAFTRNNYANVESAFTQVDKVDPSVSYLNTSDWTVIACELHDLSTQRQKGTRSKLVGLRLDETMQMRWIGGNISGEGEKLIQLTGNNHHITFIGTTLYSEVGFPSGVIFHNSGKLEGLSVDSCILQAKTAVFSGDKGAVFDEIVFHSKPSKTVPPESLLFNCPGGTLSNSSIHCDGLGLNLKEIGTSILINPGKIEAEKDSSLKVE